MNIPALDPELLQAFVAVADQRSFTRAAATLNRTQSAVSMQIKRLEDRLGVELFHRTKANVDLSSAGEGLLGYARRILALNDEAVAQAARAQGRRRGAARRDGRLRHVDRAAAARELPRRLSADPCRDGDRADLVMPARLGKAYDLVIAMHPAGRGEGEFLRREQAVWATSAYHPVEEQDPLPVALYPQGCLFRKWAMEALDAARAPLAAGLCQPEPCRRRSRLRRRGLRDRGEGGTFPRGCAAVGARRHAAIAGRRHLPASRRQPVAGRRAARRSFAHGHLE